MKRRTAQRIPALAVAVCSMATLCGPTPAAADGTGPTGGTAPPTAPDPTPPLPSTTADPAIVVAEGPVTVRVRPAALLGRTLNFRGRTSASSVGATVLIQRLDPLRAVWSETARAVVNGHGHFVAQWRTNLVGRLTVRAVVTSARAARAGRRSGTVSSSAAEITVYAPALATYFGPGFYGHRTACGQAMTPSLVGVANRTLPCGTLVAVNFAGRNLVVPVVDRGPYANGASWDLTIAAAQALGMSGTSTIGTIVASPPGAGARAGSPTPPDASAARAPHALPERR